MNKISHTEYLYGIDVDTKAWLTLSYPEALTLKAQLAYNRIGVLNQAHYLEKDSANITDCVNAQKFNENLIKEMQ